MRWKWVFMIAAGVMIALSVAVYVILSSYDFNRLKPQIAQAVKDATGRELTLGGDIRLQIGLTPALVVENVSFQNALWGSRPEMAKIKRFEVQAALIPLVSGKIEIKRFVLMEPDILVETDKSGNSNLTFAAARPTPLAQSEGTTAVREAKLPMVTFDAVQIEKANIEYKDGRSGKTYKVALENLTTGVSSSDVPIQLEGKGAFDDKAFEISATLGPLLALTEPGRVWPVKATAKAAGVTFSVDGEIRDAMHAASYTLSVNAKGDSIADLARLGRADNVPELGPFRALAKIAGQKDNLSIQVSDFRLSAGENDIEGSMQVNLSADIPVVQGSLSSNKLDLRPFMNSDKDAKAPAGRPTTTVRRDKVFPAEPLSLEALKPINANLQIRAHQIFTPRLLIKDLTAGLVIQDGALTLNPVKAEVGGGTLDGRIGLSPKGKAVEVETVLKINKLDVDVVARQLEVKEILGGKLDLDLNVKGLGGSFAEIMAGLNGKTLLVMSNGRIHNKYIDLLGANVGSSALRLLNPFSHTTTYAEINCFVSGFDINNGIAHSKALVLDTNHISVVGEGTVNLKTEALDLSFKPSPKEKVGTSGIGKISMSLGELAKPLKLGGTLAKPALSIDPTRAALTIGETVGGAALFGPLGIVTFLARPGPGEGNVCLAAMDASKKGVKPSGGGVGEEIRGAARRTTDAVGDKLKKMFGR
jgi:AsmA family protein